MQRDARRQGGTRQPQWDDEGEAQPDGSVRHSALILSGQRYSLGKSDIDLSLVQRELCTHLGMVGTPRVGVARNLAASSEESEGCQLGL